MVPASNVTISTTIHNLIGGVVYRFSVMTLINEITSEMRATVVHSTSESNLPAFYAGARDVIK